MLSIAELLACGDVETICSIDLAKAFTYSLENDLYFSEVVSVHEGSVEQFCVPIDVGISAISSCGSYLYQADFSDLVGVQFVNSGISSPQTKLISSEVYFLLFDLYDPSIGSTNSSSLEPPTSVTSAAAAKALTFSPATAYADSLLSSQFFAVGHFLPRVTSGFAQ